MWRAKSKLIQHVQVSDKDHGCMTYKCYLFYHNSYWLAPDVLVRGKLNLIMLHQIISYLV